MDNFFTSVSLLEDLKNDHTFAIGTARSNRKKWPPELKDVKALKKVLKRVEVRSVFLEQENINALYGRTTL